MLIPIDPIEELLKGIEIVHGLARANMWRRILFAINQRQIREEQDKRVRMFCEAM